MTTHFRIVEEDPFVDLFDRGIGQRRGALIARDILDSTAQVSDQAARAFFAGLFLKADPEVNPFLALPEHMLHAGIPSTPYQLWA